MNQEILKIQVWFITQTGTYIMNIFSKKNFEYCEKLASLMQNWQKTCRKISIWNRNFCTKIAF